MISPIANIRNEFPILSRDIGKSKLVYLDNAATVQKPLQVLKAINSYYTLHNSNVHRGVHTLSQEASSMYEDARKTIKEFINADSAQEVIFTKGTTEGINLVASTYCEKYFEAGDEIILTTMEHHSNIVPWQLLSQKKKLVLKVLPIDAKGNLVLEKFKQLITPKTKLIAVTHVSNTLGTVNPIAEIVQMAHQHHILVLVDGAQAAPHTQVNVQKLDVDFYVFSGHKMYAPTGIGVLYAKQKHIQIMPPYQGGGGMIRTVSFEGTEFAEGALKFEAGTPNIEGAIGMKAAIDFIQAIGIDTIYLHEMALHDYALRKLETMKGITIIGKSEHKAAVISFVVDGVHPFDIGTLLDKMGVAVRTGHHCTQPLMNFFGITGTVRVSFAVYNTFEEVDIFIASLQKCLNMLQD